MIARYGLFACYQRDERHHSKRGDTQANFQLDESPVEYALS